MNKKFAIGIPTINRSDLLNVALEKYFNNFPNVEIFIIDNGDQNISQRNKKFNYFSTGENYGVAKSWNYLCDKIFDNHEYALILNDDIVLDLNEEELESFFDGQTFDLIRCNKNYEMSSFALTKKCFSEFRFDEAFYPAYFEDLDFIYRLKLSNKKIIESSFLNPSEFINSGSISENGGDPSLVKNFPELLKIFIEKWGGTPGKELFVTPFNKLIHNDKIIEIIAVTYDHGYKLKCFIDSILSQSSNNWRLHIIHDGGGKLYESTKLDLENDGYLKDERIVFSKTSERFNDYGHSLRKFGLENPISDSEYTVITNCDNYYVPEWISFVNNAIVKDPDFIMWDCVHNHSGNTAFDRINPYGLCVSKLHEGHIDIGSVALKTNIASKVGFKHIDFHADWLYFEECLEHCDSEKIKKIPCILFVHN
jgi:hypothetical protein